MNCNSKIKEQLVFIKIHLDTIDSLMTDYRILSYISKIRRRIDYITNLLKSEEVTEKTTDRDFIIRSYLFGIDL